MTSRTLWSASRVSAHRGPQAGPPAPRGPPPEGRGTPAPPEATPAAAWGGTAGTAGRAGSARRAAAAGKGAELRRGGRSQLERKELGTKGAFTRTGPCNRKW